MDVGILPYIIFFDILTVCFIIGALTLLPADGLGCLSIDGGTGLSFVETIGSFSLKEYLA